MVYNNKIFAVPLAQSQFYWGLWGHQEILEANKLDWPKSAHGVPSADEAVDERRSRTSSASASKLATATRLATPMSAASCGRRSTARRTTGASAAPASGPRTGRRISSRPASSWRATCSPTGRSIRARPTPRPPRTTPFESGKFAYRFSNALNVNHFDTGAVPIHRIMTTQNPPWKVRLAPPLPAEAGGKAQYNLGIGNFGLLVLKKARPGADQAAAEHHQLHRVAVRQPGVSDGQLRGQGPGLQVRRQRQSAADPAGRGQHDRLAGCAWACPRRCCSIRRTRTLRRR